MKQVEVIPKGAAIAYRPRRAGGLLQFESATVSTITTDDLFLISRKQLMAMLRKVRRRTRQRTLREVAARAIKKSGATNVKFGSGSSMSVEPARDPLQGYFESDPMPSIDVQMAQCKAISFVMDSIFGGSHENHQ